MDKSDLIFKEESYRIVGACFHVYEDKGCGFTEPLYQECLGIEFDFQGISFDAQRQLTLMYRERVLSSKFIPDYVCFDKIIVELKAVSDLTDEHRSRVLNYLNATGYELGLLINFGHYPKLEYERIANTRNRTSILASNSAKPFTI
jgi:GxxExxY protein